MRIVSYNIQAAIGSDSYLSHLTRLHHQVMPAQAKARNLEKIARFISDFDVVCLQEIDLGGYRNGFQNQVKQILDDTPFDYFACQTNRVVGKLSLHGNLILSRLPLREIVNCPLPSRIKGRGMLAVAVDTPIGEVVVSNVHLSLGMLDQFKQIRFIREQLKNHENVCLMGDFNCPPHAEQLHLLTDHNYTRLSEGATYPSWRPTQSLDHIFVKGSISGSSRVLSFQSSDHLPVAIEIDTAA